MAKEKSNKNKKDDRLALNVTFKNACYALALGASISPAIVIHSFFLWLMGFGGWVFFDGVFMRRIVDALDKGLGFDYIF